MLARHPQRALNRRFDPEHEVFRGIGARAAARLGAVIAAIVLILGLIMVNTAPHEATSEAPSLLGGLPAQLERFFAARQSG